MRKLRTKKMFKTERTAAQIIVKNLCAVLLFLFLCPYIISSLLSPDYVDKTTADLTLERESRINVETISEAGTTQIGMEHYLLLLLPTVISAGYEEETLKAQVILLRTNLIRSYRQNEKLIFTYPQAVVMTDDERQKVRKAVEETAGLFVSYEGEAALVPYFQVSTGKTRNPDEVWGENKYPYLCVVDCPRDYLCENYISKTMIKKDVFEKNILEYLQEKKVQKTEYKKLVKDEAGYALEVFVELTYENGNRTTKRISGEEFRKLFHLPSACIEITEERGEITFHTKGVGHGIGMSQYNANELALQGEDYFGILNTFFTNIAIDKFE